MSFISRYIIIFLTITMFISAGCSKETKLLSKGVYKDASEISVVEPDLSMHYHDIIIPKAETNKSWRSSSFSLDGVSENIDMPKSLSKENTYRLYRASIAPDISRNIVIKKNVIFTLNNSSMIYAYSAVNPGNLIWKKALNNSKGEFIGGGIAAYEGYIAATYGDKDLVLLNSKNGKELWRYELSNIARSTPIIHRNKVFISTVDNKIYAINLFNGILEWTYENAIEEVGILGHASLEASEEVLIAPSSSGQISAIDIKNGELLWNTLLGSGVKQAYVNDIDTTPVINNNIVYVSNYGGLLLAINIKTGEIEWQKENNAGNNVIWIADDFIYTINKEKKLLAIYKETGAIKWVHSLLNDFSKNEITDETKFSGPIMINGNLYIATSNGNMVSISAKTGKKISKKQIINNVYSPPVAVNNKLYLFSNSGYLSVLS